MKMLTIFVSLVASAFLYLPTRAEFEAILYQHCMDQEQFHAKTDEAFKQCLDPQMNVSIEDIPPCMLTSFGYADKHGFVTDIVQFSQSLLPVYKTKLNFGYVTRILGNCFQLAVNDTIAECWNQLWKGDPIKYQDFDNCLDPILREKCYKWIGLKSED